MKIRFSQSILGFILVLISSTAVMADNWSQYDAPEYGFSMFVPESAVIREYERGAWGGIYAYYKGLKLWGLAKTDEKASASEIEKFGIKITEISKDHWQEIDSGSGDGWEWYKTVKARFSNRIIFGGYGVGPMGSYLILLKTTQSDFEENESDYMEWYSSIKLY